MLTTQSATRLIQRTFPVANAPIARLVDADILTPIKAGYRNRAFEARDIIDAFSDLERQLASPAGNTAIAPSAHKVPYRKRSSKMETTA
jgi:hypothetical protein